MSDYDAALDSFRSWEDAIGELRKRHVGALSAESTSADAHREGGARAAPGTGDAGATGDGSVEITLAIDAISDLVRRAFAAGIEHERTRIVQALQSSGLSEPFTDPRAAKAPPWGWA